MVGVGRRLGDAPKRPDFAADESRTFFLTHTHTLGPERRTPPAAAARVREREATSAAGVGRQRRDVLSRSAARLIDYCLSDVPVLSITCCGWIFPVSASEKGAVFAGMLAVIVLLCAWTGC